MKQLKLLAFLLIATTAFAQNKLELSSKIETVTVYYDGALVNRVANSHLQSGTTDITLKGITKYADVSNLQVKGEGDFSILKVNPVPNYLREKESKNDMDELQKRNKTIEQKIKDLETDKTVYTAERDLVRANQNIKGDAAVLSVQQLKDMADFFRLRLTEIESKILGIDRDITKLADEKKRNEDQLKSLANYKDDMTYDVVVTVMAKAATDAKISLTYFTDKAGWFASYDLKVANVNDPIKLNLRANVMQNSGEDWNNVKLTLSTGTPSISNDKPLMEPWFLNFSTSVYKRQSAYNPNPTLTEASGMVINSQTGLPLTGASIMIKGTGIGTTTDQEGYFKLTTPKNSNMLIVKYAGFEPMEVWPGVSMDIQLKLAEVDKEVTVTAYRKPLFRRSVGARYNIREVVGTKASGNTEYSYNTSKKKDAATTGTVLVVSQPTTYVYIIDEPYTISSNGKSNAVGIKDYQLDAYYEYYCAPKLDKDAFLTAKVSNWQQFDLIDGETNVYFENTFIGKSLLDLTNSSDTLEVSLGRDRNVVVDLKHTKDYTQKQFLGTNRVDKRAWEIVVKNRKKQEINIVVQDRFPISQNSDITVDNIDLSGAEFEKDSGILTWRMKIATNAEQKVTPQYSVKYPKNKIVYLE